MIEADRESSEHFELWVVGECAESIKSRSSSENTRKQKHLNHSSMTKTRMDRTHF